MKYILILLLFMAAPAMAQNTKGLTLDADTGVVVKPLDFWEVNKTGISTALSNGTSTSNATVAAAALAATANTTANNALALAGTANGTAAGATQRAGNETITGLWNFREAVGIWDLDDGEYRPLTSVHSRLVWDGNEVAIVSDLNYRVPVQRRINTASPLAGGGNLTGDLTLSVQTANATQGGVLTNGTQTIAGNKSFLDSITLGDAAGDTQTLRGAVTAPDMTSLPNGASVVTRDTLAGIWAAMSLRRWNIPLNTGWTFTTNGTASGYMFGTDALVLVPANTSAFGNVTASFATSGISGAPFRLGQTTMTFGYGGINFGNTIHVYFRLGTVFNYVASRTSFALVIGPVGGPLFPVSALTEESNASTFAVAVRSIGGNVTLTARNGGNVTISNVVDTLPDNRNNKYYWLRISGGTAELYNAMTLPPTLLGSVTGAPTGQVGVSGVGLYFGASNTSNSTVIQDFITINQLSVGWD